MTDEWMKLYTLEDGRQVLAVSEYNDEDHPALRLTWKTRANLHIVNNMTFGFNDEESRDKAFSELTEQQVHDLVTPSRNNS